MAKVIIEGPGGTLASTDVLQDIGLSGNYTIDGDPILGGNLDADDRKITRLANPTNDQDAVNQRTLIAYQAYSPIILAFLPPATTWTANNYLGLGSTASTSGITAWVAPANGTLLGFRFYSGVNAAGSNMIFTFFKSSYLAAGGTFSTTSISINLSSGNKQAFNNSDTIAVSTGDIIVVQTDTTFATGTAGGFTFSAAFVTDPQF